MPFTKEANPKHNSSSPNAVTATELSPIQLFQIHHDCTPMIIHNAIHSPSHCKTAARVWLRLLPHVARCAPGDPRQFRSCKNSCRLVPGLSGLFINHQNLSNVSLCPCRSTRRIPAGPRKLGPGMACSDGFFDGARSRICGTLRRQGDGWEWGYESVESVRPSRR